MRTVQYRRKREGKTNFRRRLKMVLGRTPRLVIRQSLRNITVQVIDYSEVGDEVVMGINSRTLEKYGWKGHSGNIPTAYLTGLLLGKRAVKKGMKEAILDVGLMNPVKGGRTYACLKGAIDGGLKVPHSEEVLPDESRVRGKHIAEFASKMSDDQLKVRFGEYFAKGADPRGIEKVFEEVKNKIEADK